MRKINVLNWIALAALVLVIAFVAYRMMVKIPNVPVVPTAPSAPAGTYSSALFDPKAAIAGNSFKTAAEFNKFLNSYSSGGGFYQRYGGVAADAMMPTAGGVAVKAAAESSIGASAPAPNTGTTQTDYSHTNNQVATVDEADLIKTDGNYIYTVSGNVVYIIKAYPGEDAEIVSRITLNNTNPSNLFIDGDHLAVFGDFYDNAYFQRMDIRPRSGMTFFNVYDVSDKANPTLIKDYKFEGNYFDARLKDGFVYFVSRSYPEYRPEPMPLYMVGDVKKEMPIDSIRYFNYPYRSPSMVTVSAINLKTPGDDVNSKSLVVEGGENVYMSDGSLYITYTEYINEYDLRTQIVKDVLVDSLSDADRALIDKIKSTDNDVLSQYEKDAKILQVYYDYFNYLPQDQQDSLNEKVDTKLKEKLKEYDHLEYTVINKVMVDKGNIEVGETGKVPGHIMNQFSMDEKDGLLRIATTISPTWSYSYMTKNSAVDSVASPTNTKSTNGVYALDSNMKIAGRLEGLAEDESIYSTRFIGDKLYMVTYQQVDPFFVIDLTDPAHPKELGKLKIPGFSRYLHPYDENTIIGIGNEATDNGRVEGLKISLFDVSDFAHPKEIAKFVTDQKYATSTALYEHKAFLFSKDKNLLVIPAYSYNYDYTTGQMTGGYNGAFVFKITKDEITLRGLIDHSQGQQPYYYGAMVERSLYINELLYTKSPGLLRINRIDDLSSVKNITLGQATTEIQVY